MRLQRRPRRQKRSAKQLLFDQSRVRQLRKVHIRMNRFMELQQRLHDAVDAGRMPVQELEDRLRRFVDDFKEYQKYQEELVTGGDAAVAEALQVLLMLDRWRDGYQLSRNPVFVFRAVPVLLDYRLPFPAWVRNYLRRAAIGITEKRPRGAKAVAQHFGFGTRRGNSEATKADTVDRQLRILGAIHREFAAEVKAELQGHPARDDFDIWVDIEEKLGVSDRLVAQTYRNAVRLGILLPRDRKMDKE